MNYYEFSKKRRKLPKKDVQQRFEDGDYDPGYQIMNEDEIVVLNKNVRDSSDVVKKPKLSLVREPIDIVYSCIIYRLICRAGGT